MLYNLLNENLPDNHKRYCSFDELTPFISAIESAWVSGHNQVSIPFWMDKLGHQLVSRAIYALAKADWITSKVIKRFGVLSLNQSTLDKYLTSDEQLAFRTQSRLRKYRMRLVEEVQPSNITKVGQEYLETGLDRPGFAQCANNKFSLDTQYIAKYYDAIHANALKSMVKMAQKHKSITEDPANYGIIVTELLDWHLFNSDAQFNMEANFSDQRGRAIYKGLRRVFNPIASKDARSMLVADRGIVVSANDTKQMDDIYLFIAELIGAKPTTWESKKLIGMDAYNTRDLHTLDLTDDRDLKELHENVWLERIYDRLDKVNSQGYAYWDIPLEMDQTALTI